MSPTHLILEGRFAGSRVTFLRIADDGVLVDLGGMLLTFHPSALRPLL